MKFAKKKTFRIYFIVKCCWLIVPVHNVIYQCGIYIQHVRIIKPMLHVANYVKKQLPSGAPSPLLWYLTFEWYLT